MDNKPIHIHTEPGYVNAKDDAALNMANERRSGVYTKFASGFKLEKTAALTVTLRKGIYSHQGHKYIVYQDTSFTLIAAATGQKKIAYLVSEYVYKSGNVQEHTLKILQGTSAVSPSPPALKTANLFGIEATTTSQEAIYQIDIIEGSINKISLVTSVLDGVDTNDIQALQQQIDTKTDKTWTNAEQQRVNAAIDKKADTTHVNQQNALKVDKTVYDAKMTMLDNKNSDQDTKIAENKGAASTANTNAIDANNNANTRVKQTTYDAKMTALDNKGAAQDTAIKDIQKNVSTNVTEIGKMVKKSGDVMSGALQLPPSNPSGDYHAVHKTYVVTELAKKVNLTTYDAKIKTLDDKDKTQDTAISAKLETSTFNAYKTTNDNKVNTKADKTYVDTQDTALGKRIDTNVTNIDKKADKTYTDTELGKKADKGSVQMQKITADNGSGKIHLPNNGGKNLQTEVLAMANGFAYIFVYCSGNSGFPSGLTGYLAGYATRFGDIYTIILVHNTTNDMYRCVCNKTTWTGWEKLPNRGEMNLKADKTATQLKKITNDNGSVKLSTAQADGKANPLDYFKALDRGLETFYIPSSSNVTNATIRGLALKTNLNDTTNLSGAGVALGIGGNRIYTSEWNGNSTATNTIWQKYLWEEEIQRMTGLSASGSVLAQNAQVGTNLLGYINKVHPGKTEFYITGNISNTPILNRAYHGTITRYGNRINVEMSDQFGNRFFNTTKGTYPNLTFCGWEELSCWYPYITSAVTLNAQREYTFTTPIRGINFMGTNTERRVIKGANPYSLTEGVYTEFEVHFTSTHIISIYLYENNKKLRFAARPASSSIVIGKVWVCY